MKNRQYFQDKKITVVGLGRSGLACADLLFGLGAKVSITDNQDNDATRLNASKLKNKNIDIELGKHSQAFIKGSQLVVVSPGILPCALPIIWAKELFIPLISEIEVASILCPAKIIAVTGSNGKTTVTTLIGKILEAQGKRVFVCGNIGNPFCAEVAKMKEGDFVSLEVSSFQLETIKTFKPKISLMLNLCQNHLDRYSNLQDYFQAKKRIFINQDKDDYLVLNQDDPAIKAMAKEARATIVYFRRSEDLNPNQAAVVAVGSILNIEKELCQQVFGNFRGVEHRLELVGSIGGIEFINDSKSTTVDSTIWALNSISCPIVLIAGGKDKGCDYSAIADLIRKKVKKVILIGQAKEKIKKALKGPLPISEAPTLEEAVRASFTEAESGDCVLLSPMCSSFDMFANYEERGAAFKKTALDLIKNGP